MVENNKKAVRRSAIHTVLVLLTSQAVRRVPASEGQADHNDADNEHHYRGQDWNQNLWLEPSPDPGGQLFVVLHVARKRGDSSWNIMYLYGGLGYRAPRTPRQ